MSQLLSDDILQEIIVLKAILLIIPKWRFIRRNTIV